MVSTHAAPKLTPTTAYARGAAAARSGAVN
jgi:hypothetical protein